MNASRGRRASASSLVLFLSILATGCMHYESGAQPPSVLAEPPQNLATQCQIANRDLRARVSMPSLRGRCNAWADRQTGVLGF